MSQSWVQRVDLTTATRHNLQRFTSAERGYYNMLLDGLAGPIRTMPEAIKKFTGRMENVLAIIAATRIDLSKIKEDSVPAPLAPYTDLLFKDGKLALDPKVMLILDLVRKESDFHPHVRAGIAIEMLRYAIDQISVLNRTDLQSSDDASYKYAIKMLTPLDARNKRHIQLPKTAVNASVADNVLTLNIPYFSAAIQISAPGREWNYVIVREDDDGRMTIELSKESSRYLLRRFDQVSRRKTQSQTNGKMRRAGQTS